MGTMMVLYPIARASISLKLESTLKEKLPFLSAEVPFALFFAVMVAPAIACLVSFSITFPEITVCAKVALTVKQKINTHANHNPMEGTLLIIKPKLYKDTICCESSRLIDWYLTA